ncbi:MAG TPA: DUF3365 domain-containing protein [Zoogloea sp.]|nr:DUF3365 domain-containing protein [Zoogloea sp.]
MSASSPIGPVRLRSIPKAIRSRAWWLLPLVVWGAVVAASLEAFERGTPETMGTETGPRGTVLRYMAPLRVQESCMACHAKQGYTRLWSGCWRPAGPVRPPRRILWLQTSITSRPTVST